MWLASVQDKGVREPSEVWDLACLLCRKIVLANRSLKDPFAVSDREFAELLGIDTRSVRRRVQPLLDKGLLQKHAPRTPFHLPSEYTLITPDPTEAHRNSHSEGKTNRSLYVEGEGLVRYAAVERALRRVELGRHRMFQQMDDGALSLPRSAIRIIDALGVDPAGMKSLSELARRTLMDRSTAQRTVDALADFDLVEREGRRIRLVRMDVEAALEDLAAAYDVPDRAAVRKLRHERERQAKDAYDREHHRGRHGPKGSGRVSFNPQDWANRGEEDLRG